MGDLVWHEYSRYVSITASTYAAWAAFFGLFYRKFFWDFIGGTLRDPGGIQPSPKAAFFIRIIVQVPIIQIISLILGLAVVALEFPLPGFRDLRMWRSFVFRALLLLLQAVLTVLFYQGTNAALWSLIAVACYTKAEIRGERLASAKTARA